MSFWLNLRRMGVGLCLVAVALIGLPGCVPTDEFTRNLPAKPIDLTRYVGTWYEIARIPNWFEQDLVGVTATYTAKGNGKFEVRNEGRLDTLTGKQKTAIGEAWVPNSAEPGRLKVSFFFFVAADYVVFDIDPNYQYALVGSSKNFLWILSRSPVMSKSVYDQLVARAAAGGYDVSRLEKVQQLP